MQKLKRLALIVGLVAVPAFFATAPFILFSKVAEREIERRGLTAAEHNSLKHAYAAAELYTHLRPVLGESRAEDAVLWIGEMLERVEQYVNHDTDVAREVYKDLRNNLYGMVAARWLQDEEGISDWDLRLRLIGWLAEADGLADWAEDARIPESLPFTPDIDAAVAAARADRTALENEFRAVLDARRTDISRDLGISRDTAIR